MPLFATASGHAWGWVMECRERLSTGAQGGSTSDRGGDPPRPAVY